MKTNRSIFIRSYLAISAALLACFVGPMPCCATQSPAGKSNTTDKVGQQVQLQGLISSRKKYSFTVIQNQTEYTVKLAPGAPVALKMNKPWFDWEKNRVVVNAVSYSAETEPIPIDTPQRVAIPLPAENLFLISRFRHANHVKAIMAADVKRINLYLVTPETQGEHFPTAEQPYLSGPLSVENKQLQVTIDEQTLPVKLGYRYATMNGFTISQLEPNKTRVFLSGTWADGAKEIEATSVLFQPVALPQTETKQDDHSFSLPPAGK